jgi:hypothetical protein
MDNVHNYDSYDRYKEFGILVIYLKMANVGRNML